MLLVDKEKELEAILIKIVKNIRNRELNQTKETLHKALREKRLVKLYDKLESRTNKLEYLKTQKNVGEDFVTNSVASEKQE